MSKEVRQIVDQIHNDRSSSVTLVTDPEALDCFICYERLTVPVFQCVNGHSACSSCCDKIGKKCPACSKPIGTIRCRTIEKLLESLKVSCINAKFGCKDLLSYNEINEHKNSCIYETCFCPHLECNFAASSKELSLHVSQKQTYKRVLFGRRMSDQPLSSLGKKKQRTNTSQSGLSEEVLQIVDRIHKDRYISLTLVNDPEVLDCFICYERLTVPVFQCVNGHTACSSCCDKVDKKCAACFKATGTIRCRTIEKLLDCLKVSCINAIYGCTDLLSYNEINEHQNSCFYEPCFCPHLKCNFVASLKDLSLHFSSKHMGSAIQFEYDKFFWHHISIHVQDKVTIFQEKNKGDLFILNNYVVKNVGNAFNLSSIGPKSSKERHRYWVNIQNLTLSSCTQSNPGSNCNISSLASLLIPSNLVDASGQLKLQFYIHSYSW